MPVTVIPTRNFERNLDATAAFLIEQGEPTWFDALLDRLFDVVIPNLESFPDMGRVFLSRMPASAEGLYLHDNITASLENVVVREYLFDQYLLLYGVSGSELYLLSIKHHAQLSFDLNGHWY